MDKNTALTMISQRINGLKATISKYTFDRAEYDNVTRLGQKFVRRYEPKPVDESAINREIDRLLAAQKEVKKQKA